jgi:hypothetical protein
MPVKTHFLHFSFTSFAIGVVFAAGLVPSLSAAQSVADYVGSYRRGSVDSVEQLVLLDDKTYCYAVTAGSLDLLSGGRWTLLPDPDGGNNAVIALQEVKPKKPIFPAIAKSVEEQGQGKSGKVIFDFHGHSLSRAGSAVFAVSSSDEWPKLMQPLFPEDHNGWSSSYKLPAMDVGKVRYFYMGYIAERDRNSRRTDVTQTAQKLQVYQYKLDKGNAVRIGFDQTYAAPLIQLSLQWKKGDKAPVAERALHSEGDKPFGSKKPLTEQVLNGARSRCIEPALSTASIYEQPRRDGGTLLEPVKEQLLDVKAVQGKPWFALVKEN